MFAFRLAFPGHGIPNSAEQRTYSEFTHRVLRSEGIDSSAFGVEEIFIGSEVEGLPNAVFFRLKVYAESFLSSQQQPFSVVPGEVKIALELCVGRDLLARGNTPELANEVGKLQSWSDMSVNPAGLKRALRFTRQSCGMHDRLRWRPQYSVGKRVLIVTAGMHGVVVEIEADEAAYVIEINGNPACRILCTEVELEAYDEPRPSLRTPVVATVTRVLVVDDYPVWADRIVQMLRAAGFMARAAYGGEDALRLAADFQPSVLISDVHMPKMNGFQLAEACIQQVSVCCVLLLTTDLHLTLNETELRPFKTEQLQFELLHKPPSIESLLGFVSACPCGCRIGGITSAGGSR